MKRRQALGAIGGLLLVASVLAQQARPIVIGLLDGGDRLEWWSAFRKRMIELGYVEGRNVTYLLRMAKGDNTLLPALAKELVQANVTVFVTAGVAAASAAQHATTTIPIVMASGTDQVSMGLVRSLSRPGGNVTGVSSLNSELAGKRFEIMRDLVPKSMRLGALWHRDNPGSTLSVRETESAATAARIAFHSFGILTVDDLGESFASMSREKVDALIVINSPLIYSLRKPIVDLALKYRIPAMYGAAEYVEVGGLISYASSYVAMFRDAALYVDKVLKGANPATLPIAQPTKIELVINSRTAKTLGVALTSVMLARADRVIE